MTSGAVVARSYKQGRYRPVNPGKYVGNPNNIVYRSSWELRVMRKFDVSPRVIRWSSEEFIVPYYDTIKGHARRYFPDFVITKLDDDGVERSVMVEVKPLKETLPPVHKAGKRRQTIINEEITWRNNSDKWKAAEEYCKRNGWEFLKITERELGML